MKKSLIGALVSAVVAAPLAGLAFESPASAAVTTEGFETVPPAGWTTANNSNPVGSTSVFQGSNVAAGGPFDSQAGAVNSYAGMNYQSTGSTGTISTWLVTPQYTSLSNGDVMSFYTRKVAGQDYPDRLEVRMSTNGLCSPGAGAASVGDFTTTLITVNPTLVGGVYPTTWTQFTVTLSGITGAKSGCFAFRYFVTNAGLNGANSDYIGIDTYAYDDQPTDVTPPDTTITSTPNAVSNDTSASFNFTSTEAGTFECSMDGAPYAACSGSGTHTVNGLADGDHTFGVQGVDLAGNIDPTPATYAFTVDTAAPETMITSGPATGTTTGDATPTFEFDSSEAGSTFECSVDSAVFASCSTPLTTAALDDGAHTFEVRSTDAVGNTDQTPATSSFTVDSAAPETTITLGPATGTTTGDATPTFGFDSSEAGATFECSVDSAVFASCSNPLTTAALDDGAHAFEVRSTDAVGNTDQTPATSSFTVDATAPNTSITSGPATGTTTDDPTPTFEFDSSEAGSTFECSVDSAVFASCSNPLTTAALDDGAHTFEVRSTDAVGNTDQTPATSSFTVDTTAPDTSITSGPGTGTTTDDATPTFGFSSSEAGSTFECSIDSAVFSSCSSPLTTAALGDGAHTFEVRSTDAVGNTDATPATSSFAVDTTAPDTSITSGPGTDTTTQDTTPTFGFSSPDAGAIFACSVDGAVFGPCSGPGATHTTAVLPLGTHTFSVRATDALANTDASPATTSFRVVAPSTTPPPSADCASHSAAVAKVKGSVAKAKANLKKAKRVGNDQAVERAKFKFKRAKKALRAASAALATCQAG